MPLGQLTSTAREIKRLYLTPTGKRASASVSLHSPIGGSFALAVTPTVQADRLLDQSVFQAGTSGVFGYRVKVTRDGVYMGKADSGGGIEIWKRVNGAWSFIQTITGISSAPSGYSGGSPGLAFAFSGDGSRLIVGENNFTSVQASQGRARVYTRTGDTFNLAYNISTLTPTNGGYFGNSVDISGDGLQAVIGAPGESAGAAAARGVVYGYNLGPTSATLQVSVGGPANIINEYFGFNVAISDANLFAASSAYLNNAQSPVAYVYTFNGGIQKFSTPGPTPSNAGFFGEGLALSADGSRLVVGDWSASTNQGRAYVYSLQRSREVGAILSTGNYALAATLEPTGNTSGAYFGFSVAISADNRFVTVGAPRQIISADLGGEGVSYLFRRNLDTYELMDSLAPLGRSGSQFNGNGVSVVSLADSLLAFSSAYSAVTTSGNSPGVAYVYEYPLPTTVTDEVVGAAAGTSIEKTGLVLEPADAIYVINRRATPLNALAVGYSENA